MASRKFRFVSPGVFLKEVDNSQLPAAYEGIGPVIIGRTRKGPAMKPVKIRSLVELERVFGHPMPGNQGEDPWRDGTHLLAESYAPFAAKAHLEAGVDSPVTMIRLAGIAGDDARAIDSAEPGWKADHAWGLFFGDNQTSGSNHVLGAVFYGKSSDFAVKVKGKNSLGNVITASGSVLQHSDSDEITLQLSADSKDKEVKFTFENMRKELNVNPVATNLKIAAITSGSLAEHYWLGETFDEAYKEYKANLPANAKKTAMTVKLSTLMSDFKSASNHALTPARSGWVFGQDTSGEGSKYNPDHQERLFRLIALQEGVQSNKLLIGIEDIQVPRPGATNPYGTFSVVVKEIGAVRVEEVERFDNCNLNPNSQNFVAKLIGDQYFEWSASEKRNKLYGSNPNISDYIRVEMNENVAQNGPTDASHVPFGFLGPVIPKKISGNSAAKATAAVATMILGSVPADDTIIQITNHLGADQSFKISTGNTTVDGTTLHDGMINIGISGVSDAPGAATRIRSAINNYVAAEGNVINVSAGGAGATVTITQGVAGAAGNKSGGKGNINHTLGAAVSSLTQFTGGSNSPEGSSKLWVGQHFNTSGSFAFWSTPNTQDIPSVREYTLSWPSPPVVSKADSTKNYIFGACPYEMSYSSGSIASPGDVISAGYADTVRRLSTQTNLCKDQNSGLADDVNTQHAYKFTLDEVVLLPVAGATGSISTKSDVREAHWLSGSRTAARTDLHNHGRNYAGSADRNAAPALVSGSTAASGSFYMSWTQFVDQGSGSLRTMLDIVKGFDMPMCGGFDGTDITEANPFNNRVLRDATTANSYAYASIDRAIDLIKNPEAIEHNLALMPGVTNDSLTSKLVSTCEARADSMALIDLKDIYIPPSEDKCTSFKDRVDGTTAEKSAAALVKRQINSSYGAAYYPWVKIKDESSNRDVWVPPSVVALGVMAHTQKTSEVWFAPAGFNRGGLNKTSAGLPVLQASEQLLSKDRDTLYQANINPIASFVSEGLVIFGQKTLQSTPSALDRINVRRLLIFVKKAVSRICNNLLFEQNVRATWLRFINQVQPVLDEIKTRFGLTDYKIVLDDTTTTPDLVDRNIMYAKIFLKPARSIEFIAVDFVITRTGAGFND